VGGTTGRSHGQWWCWQVVVSMKRCNRLKMELGIRFGVNDGGDTETRGFSRCAVDADEGVSKVKVVEVMGVWLMGFAGGEVGW
jgi:hypothetical protein